VDKLLKELERLLEGIQLTGEVTPRLRARALSVGELCSSHMGRAYLARELKGKARVSRVDARELLVATDRPADPDDTRFLEADVLPRAARAESMSKLVQPGVDDGDLSVARVVITQGFIGYTAAGQTCVLGRGGSDTSGTLFAALLKAKRCEIWTDVYGLFTCDPRVLPEARLIREISYREAQELAALGAKVLHPRCLGPAHWGGIPVEVRNTMDPQGSERGVLTRICANPDEGAAAGKPRVVAVTKRMDQILLTIHNNDMAEAVGFLSRIFAPFATMGVAVDLIATSEYSVSMTLDNVPGGSRGPILSRVVAELRSLVPRGTVTVEDRCAVVSIVGRRLRHALPSLSRALREMRGYDVRLMSQSAEDLNLSFVVGDAEAVPGYVDQLVVRLHHALFNPGAHPPAGDAEAREDQDASIGASWDELRAGAVTPRPLAVVVAQPPPSSQLQPAQQQRRAPETTLSMPTPRASESLRAAGAAVAGWKTAMGSLAGSHPGLLLDVNWLSSMRVAPGLRLRVADLKGSQHPLGLRAMVLAGLGLECASLAEVLECCAVEAGVVAFAPDYCASEDDYARAVALGCSELVADDDVAAAMLAASTRCFRSKVYRRVEGGSAFELVHSGQGTRSGRWAALLEHDAPPPQRTVVSGAFIGPAVAVVAVVSRVVGSVVQVAHGPSPARVQQCALRVVNATRSGNDGGVSGAKRCCGIAVHDETAVGDRLVFFQSEPAGDVVWW